MLVLRNGRLAWEQYWGGADSSTAFNAKSVSKSFLSALVGIAVEQGKLSLDQRVATLLPEYFAPGPAAANRMFRAAVMRNDSMRATITIRHLLTQTSGYAWDEGGPILSTFLVSSDPARLVAEQIMAATPGTTFNYSTGNTHLLAAALARAVRHAAPPLRRGGPPPTGRDRARAAGTSTAPATRSAARRCTSRRARSRGSASSTWTGARSEAGGRARRVDRRVVGEAI